MELNREQIINGLECLNGNRVRCDDCSILKVVGGSRSCKRLIINDALSLIDELTTENEKLRAVNASLYRETELAHVSRKEHFTRAQINAIGYMQEKLKARFKGGKCNLYTVYNIQRYIDQIAEQILEEIEDGT